MRESSLVAMTASSIIRIAVALNFLLFGLLFVNDIFLRPHVRSLYGYSMFTIACVLLYGTVAQYRRKAGLSEGTYLIDMQLAIICLIGDLVVGGLMGD